MADGTVQKIRKLLELSKSPNEHEAQLALARARRMLYGEPGKKKDSPAESEYREIRTGVDFTMRRDLWAAYLAEVVAENHACVTYQIHKKKYGKTYSVVFLGKKKNAEVCAKSFEDIVRYFRKLNEKMKGSGDEEFQECFNDYVYGFTDGLREIYRRQDEEAAEKGTVIETVPKEVASVLNYIRGRKTDTAVISRRVFRQGRDSAGKGGNPE